jgi:hypothetical protein
MRTVRYAYSPLPKYTKTKALVLCVCHTSEASRLAFWYVLRLLLGPCRKQRVGPALLCLVGAALRSQQPLRRRAVTLTCKAHAAAAAATAVLLLKTFQFHTLCVGFGSRTRWQQ